MGEGYKASHSGLADQPFPCGPAAVRGPSRCPPAGPSRVDQRYTGTQNRTPRHLNRALTIQSNTEGHT